MKWQTAADSVRWNVRPFVNGRYRASSSEEVWDKINPASEELLYQLAIGSAADIDAAVRTARTRFEDGRWSQMPPGQRAAVLLKLAELMVQHKQELALLDTLEMGKPITVALYDVEKHAAPLVRSCAAFADKLLGDSAPLIGGNLQLSTYEPRGVVGAITPWNFPTINVIFKIAPALAAGNSVVLKPSELSSGSALRIAELALEAGIPEGVLNVVPGLGATAGAALASHPNVDLITFTGSTATGRKVMELAARSNGKPALLELGGKSPQVVFDDADGIDRVAAAIVQSFLRNSGQVCSAHTRLVVGESVEDALVEKVIDLTRKYKVGDPLDESTMLGPLVSPAQRERVKSYIEEGLAAGAHAVLKGTVQEHGGCYVSPTIFDGVRPEMSIAREEIFGPVLCVQVFKSEQEAIALANSTDYGLVAAVWTRDMGRARRVAHAIKAGHVVVRTSREEFQGAGCSLSHEPQKSSGFGAEIGLGGLKSYSTLKLLSFSGA